MVIAALRERREAADGERAPEPDALARRVGADHVDLAERDRLLRWVGRVHLRPAEAGQAVVVEREQEALGVEPARPARVGRSVSSVQPPCSGWPANARLFTASHASSSCADHERAHGDAVGPLRGPPRAGAARASRAARARARSRPTRRALRRLLAVEPEGDVAAALVGRRRRAPCASRPASASSSPGRAATSTDHSSGWWCARCTYAGGVAVGAPGAGSRGRRACRAPRARSRSTSPNGFAPDLRPRPRRRARGPTRRRRARTDRARAGSAHGRRGYRSHPRSSSLSSTVRTLTRATTTRRHAMEMTSYEPGVPSWVDLGTPDLDKAAAFYSGLFGWECPRGTRRGRRLPRVPRSAGSRSPVSGPR